MGRQKSADICKVSLLENYLFGPSMGADQYRKVPYIFCKQSMIICRDVSKNPAKHFLDPAFSRVVYRPGLLPQVKELMHVLIMLSHLCPKNGLTVVH